jgi:hypothetical protein
MIWLFQMLPLVTIELLPSFTPPNRSYSHLSGSRFSYFNRFVQCEAIVWSLEFPPRKSPRSISDWFLFYLITDTGS